MKRYNCKTFETKYGNIYCWTENTRYGFRHIGERIDGRKEKVCYQNRTWESFEYETLLRKFDVDTAEIEKVEAEKVNAELSFVGTIAKIGDVICDNQKDKNDWKARMLKAGLENKGLEMPDDWDSLSENDKEKRLNGVIELLK